MLAGRAHRLVWVLASLAASLVLLTMTSATSARADDPPPGELVPPVSLGREAETRVAPAYTGCGGVYGIPASNAAYEQEVVWRVNQERAANGLPPLKRSPTLEQAGRYHAADMAADNYFSHDTFDRVGGSLVNVCSWSTRVQNYYDPLGGHWQWMAENIAVGYTTPASVMSGWMASSGHRANILSPNAWEIGVGYYYYAGGTYHHYWVQDFGRRNDIFPLIINQEATETASCNVSLYVYGAGTWTEMRLRNDSDAWTAWRPFQSSLGWTLRDGVGEHVVWANMRQGGQTTISSDTIRLTTASALGNLPDTVQFTYSRTDHFLLPRSYQATPSNIGNDCPFTWTLAASGSWFAVSPMSGAASASFWITPTAYVTTTVMTYTGAITVTAASVAGSPHRIALTLRVTDELFEHVYLPLTMRNYIPPPPPPRTPNDPSYSSNQWNMDIIEAPEAWGYTTGPGVLIAVLDSGADLDHPDLAGKLRTDIDWDFVNGDATAEDDNGHGTHVSGIAAAVTDNGLGVAGVGWDAHILPLKVLNESGAGWDTDIAAAIRYAADHGADVINMSIEGASACPTILQEAVDYAYARGVVLVAAAGNSPSTPDPEVFPANCAHVLGVAATTSSDVLASYSNPGNHVSVAAPGSYIYSTWIGGGYGSMSGTSMATPHVAGLAALVLARFPYYTPDQAASAILDNAVDKGAAGWDTSYGCGRIDAFETLRTGAVAATPVCLGGRAWSAGAEGERTPAAGDYAPGEVIVSFRLGAQAEQAARAYSADAEFLPALQVWRLRVPPGEELAILAQLQADPNVAYAELNYRVTAAR